MLKVIGFPLTDRMVGTDFEAGLANLKTAEEHEPAGSPS